MTPNANSLPDYSNQPLLSGFGLSGVVISVLALTHSATEWFTWQELLLYGENAARESPLLFWAARFTAASPLLLLAGAAFSWIGWMSARRYKLFGGRILPLAGVTAAMVAFAIKFTPVLFALPSIFRQLKSD